MATSLLLTVKTQQPTAGILPYLVHQIQFQEDEFPNKKFTKHQQIGLIAQDVETIVPEVVVTDSNGYKSIDYSKLSVILIEALKEQQKRIEKLEYLIEMRYK